MWPRGLFRIACRQCASGADFSRSRSTGVFACFVAHFNIAHVAEMVKQGIEAVDWRDGNSRCTTSPEPASRVDRREAVGGLFLTDVVIYDNITIEDGQ